MTAPLHFRGIPPAINAPPAPMCDLRGTGDTTTELGRITCAECRRFLKLDAVQWKAPHRESPRMVAASREFLDCGDESERGRP